MEKAVHNKNKGILLIVTSAFFFALMGIFVKLSGDLPAVEKAFFRNLIAAIIAAIVLFKDKQPIQIGRKNYMPMFVRVTAGTIGILGNFYAVSHIMVADASMLNKLSPFATIIFSMILLREVPKKYQVFCLMLAMTGAIFVIKPGFSGNPLGMAAGLIGGVGAGLAYTMVRMLGGHRLLLLSLQLPSDGPADSAEISCPDEPIPDPHASLCRLCCCRRSVQHHRCISLCPCKGNLNLRLFADYLHNCVRIHGVRRNPRYL